MTSLPQKLLDKLESRKSENALRSLTNLKGLVDFSSNDYLGFARERKLSEQTLRLLAKFPKQNGATGSRLISGNHELYKELEGYLEKIHKVEAALVFNSGYDANLGLLSSILQRNDVIFYDEYSHASLREGIQLSNARSIKFKHNSLGDLEKKFKNTIATDKGNISSDYYLVTESVFSMDGDTPNLEALIALCEPYGVRVIIDEAHAVGVFGLGLLNQLNLQNRVFASIVTFGKALSSHGAAVLGGGLLKSYLINFARSLIYTTALSPHSVAQILAAYQLLVAAEGQDNRSRLQQRIKYFKNETSKLSGKFSWLTSDTAIQGLSIGGNTQTKQMAQHLQELGFDVRPILSPTVPKGQERIRICLHSFNTEEQIKTLIYSIDAYKLD